MVGGDFRSVSVPDVKTLKPLLSQAFMAFCSKLFHAVLFRFSQWNKNTLLLTENNDLHQPCSALFRRVLSFRLAPPLGFYCFLWGLTRWSYQVSRAAVRPVY